MKTILFTLILAWAIGFSNAQQTFNFDMSYNQTDAKWTSTGNWNNFYSSTLGTAINNFINDAGTASTYSISITDDFVAANANGTTTPGAGLIFPKEATSDSYYVQDGSNTTAAFTLTGLDPALFYSFEIFASRAGVSDVREALYTITGTNSDTGTLDAVNNTSNTVHINNIQPDASGNIVLSMAKGSGNTNGAGYCYIGAFQIKETIFPLSVLDYDFGATVKIYPNPVVNSLQLSLEVENSSNLSVQLFNVNGSLVSTLLNQQVPAGNFSQSWNKDELGNNITPGVYVLQIKNENEVHTEKVVFK